MGANDRKRLDFANFKLEVNRHHRVPISEDSYYRWGRGRRSDPVREDFTLEEIEEIIRSGDLELIRELSRYFYRTNGEYRNNIDMLSTLFLYDPVVIPVFEGKGSKTQILKAFYNACRFVDNLDLPNSLLHITREWLKIGTYNGLLREDGDKVVIQDLPLRYCRTRFKDFNNLNILELNLMYFEKYVTSSQKDEVLATFPKEIQEAYHRWRDNTVGQLNDMWVELPAGAGGINFSFIGDQTPLLIASIPELKKLQDAVDREEKRDENELYKLLIQRMPIDSHGELVFQLDEVAEIHASVADMLKDTDTVEVLTTFGDTDLESLQDSSAASQSTDRIAKYKTNAYDSLGRSSLIFNADGSSSLAYSIKKDEALMIGFLSAYETWIKFLINERFARSGLRFDFKILPTTVYNRADLQQQYFRGAQYGYSKMFAGVAMGIKQMDQLSLMDFENEFLEMSKKMVPLQSSYTTSGNVVASEEKSSSSTQKTVNTQVSEDLNNKGGRPELPDEQKSEKTQANIAAAG